MGLYLSLYFVVFVFVFSFVFCIVCRTRKIGSPDRQGWPQMGLGSWVKAQMAEARAPD